MPSPTRRADCGFPRKREPSAAGEGSLLLHHPIPHSFLLCLPQSSPASLDRILSCSGVGRMAWRRVFRRDVTTVARSFWGRCSHEEPLQRFLPLLQRVDSMSPLFPCPAGFPSPMDRDRRRSHFVQKRMVIHSGSFTRYYSVIRFFLSIADI